MCGQNFIVWGTASSGSAATFGDSLAACYQVIDLKEVTPVSVNVWIRGQINDLSEPGT